MEEKTVCEFHEAYIKADRKKLEALWKERTPSTLLKFHAGRYEPTGVNCLLDSISDKTLWLSSPRFFNDPFDCVINVDYYSEAERIRRNYFKDFLGDDDLVEYLLSFDSNEDGLLKIAESLKELNEDKNSYLENSIYVSCFSEFDNLKSIRMWAHYANNHSGVCLEYDFDDVKNASPFGCIPVRYTDDYNYLVDANDVSQNVANYLKFFTKAKEWAHEREWRVAQKNETLNMNGYKVSFDLPVSIYLGCKISDKLKEDIISICKDKGISLYQMKMKPGSFEIYPELLEN